jgi:hypothetical protein
VALGAILVFGMKVLVGTVVLLDCKVWEGTFTYGLPVSLTYIKLKPTHKEIPAIVTAVFCVLIVKINFKKNMKILPYLTFFVVCISIISCTVQEENEDRLIIDNNVGLQQDVQPLNALMVEAGTYDLWLSNADWNTCLDHYKFVITQYQDHADLVQFKEHFLNMMMQNTNFENTKDLTRSDVYYVALEFDNLDMGAYPHNSYSILKRLAELSPDSYSTSEDFKKLVNNAYNNSWSFKMTKLDKSMTQLEVEIENDEELKEIVEGINSRFDIYLPKLKSLTIIES